MFRANLSTSIFFVNVLLNNIVHTALGLTTVSLKNLDEFKL